LEKYYIYKSKINKHFFVHLYFIAVACIGKRIIIISTVILKLNNFNALNCMCLHYMGLHGVGVFYDEKIIIYYIFIIPAT
jgi:hypothetical protein